MPNLGHSESKLYSFYFFWILGSMRKVLTSFEIFSQPAGPVGKPNQPVHWVMFVETVVWVLCIVCVGS